MGIGPWIDLMQMVEFAAKEKKNDYKYHYVETYIRVLCFFFLFQDTYTQTSKYYLLSRKKYIPLKKVYF